VPSDLQYKYVVATVDVKEQTLKVGLTPQQGTAYESHSHMGTSLRAIHGRYERSIATSQRCLLPQDDLAFAIQARRAIVGLKEDIK